MLSIGLRLQFRILTFMSKLFLEVTACISKMIPCVDFMWASLTTTDVSFLRVTEQRDRQSGQPAYLEMLIGRITKSILLL